MFRSTAGATGALVLVLLLVSGCSDDEPAAANGIVLPGSAPSAEPGATPPGAADNPVPAGQPADSEASPLPPPSRPAAIASPDLSALRVGSITATVTKGGGGPCYGLLSEDGVAWSVYSKKSVPIAKGDHVQARITPGKTPVDCGSGRPATLDRIMIGTD
ncbi:hypothetical protein [Paractinoplanes brasiliensis]|uniref:Uncharacterized protein n=1 Tax=Paractinoplanes brasiliensis TaxID=52695 RepID=A0A4R6JRV6_9ACTN|nr:hypothetical protein [Actinoplanes brasiliensis]TDO39189.1 hypothetical protein C8E87_2866 [Actinoplanes brasiliensis]GID30108.1 hypothetical protein Abr02nite_50910 [Actinoplanes brasiliensis]